jgi:hypothetical protein
MCHSRATMTHARGVRGVRGARSPFQPVQQCAAVATTAPGPDMSSTASSCSMAAFQRCSTVWSWKDAGPGSASAFPAPGSLPEGAPVVEVVGPSC